MKRRRRSRPNSIGGQFAPTPSTIEIEVAHHGGRDNGQLPVPYRDFRAYGVWMGAIKPTLAELVALGFVEMTPGYACQSPLDGRAARFRIPFRDGVDGSPADLFGMLSPIHETMAAFEKGGPASTRAVERLYEKLLDVEQTLPDDDLHVEVPRLEEEVSELEETVEKLTASLEAATGMLEMLAPAGSPMGTREQTAPDESDEVTGRHTV